MKKASDDLLVRLRRADSRELLALVTDHLARFTAREARQALLNPFVTAEVVKELLHARDLMSTPEVQAAIARHRRTPPAAAIAVLPSLFWRDLMEVTVDLRIRPEVRQIAEKYLLVRLPRLTTGEKVNLARRASPALHEELIRDPDRRVVLALLGNPRLRETTVVDRVSDAKASPRQLDVVARHPVWGSRYPVRAALALNPSAPFRVLLDLLPGMRRVDLAEVAALEAHSSLVRRRAEECLDAKGGAASIEPSSENLEVHEIPEISTDATFAAGPAERGSG